MKKTLVTIILGVGLTVSAFSNSLYDKLKDKLGDQGLPKIEYFQQHGIMNTRDGDVWYRRMYLIDGKPLFADFYPYSPQLSDENTAIFQLDTGADLYYFNGTWYEDTRCDGINGNEELYNPTDVQSENLNG